jgi:glycerophosphoryl diester phosphodiesterase
VEKNMSLVKYVAHRGQSMNAPENTIPAFELAGRSGFWGIECDTYCTVDGRWIVHHDKTVDRMTDGSGNTKDFTFAEIRNLNIISGNNIENYPALKIPTLEELLNVCKKYGMYAFVEIEEYHRDTDLQTLINLVENSGMMDHCRFICFNADILRKVRSIHKDVTLGYLKDKRPNVSDLEFVHGLGRTFLDYMYTVTTTEDIRRCKDEGIEVSVWTINTLEEAQPFIDAEVDFITTDTVLFNEGKRRT